MLNWKVVVLLSFYFFLFSCQNEDDTSQPPIIEEELIQILAQAMVLEPAIREIPKIKRDSFELIVYERILSEKGYTIDAFVKSMQYIQAEPKKLTKVYEQVMEALVTLETEADNAPKNTKKK